MFWGLSRATALRRRQFGLLPVISDSPGSMVVADRHALERLRSQRFAWKFASYAIQQTAKPRFAENVPQTRALATARLAAMFGGPPTAMSASAKVLDYGPSLQIGLSGRSARRFSRS